MHSCPDVPNEVMWPPRLFQQYVISRQKCAGSNLLHHVSEETSLATYYRIHAAADAGDQDTTQPYVEVNSLLFHPNRVLLRRVFFLDADKTKYISVGFYPSRNYQPLVELGSPKVTPIPITDSHVRTLAEHLPSPLDALWRNEFFNVHDCDFCMHSASPYKTTLLSTGAKKNRRTIFLRLSEFRYLTYIFPLVQNQLAKYTEAMPDVMSYVLKALTSTTFIEPSPSANKDIFCYQFFEELKTLM